jgi:hypothetical protein
MQIWQHVTSGDRYAVHVTDDGVVTDAIGPLNDADIEIARRDPSIIAINSNAELVDDLNENTDNYRVK